MKIIERIKKVKELMETRNFDFYIVPSSDYHQSEYVGEFFKSREWISGFTGSAGTVIITKEEVGLWTDGRYFIQAEKEIEGSGITLYKMGEPGVPTTLEFLRKKCKDGQKIAFDGKVVSISFVNSLKDELKNIKYSIDCDYDLIGEVWNNRPTLPLSKAFILDEKYCGESVESKLNRIREKLEEEECDMNIITSLDDIAWIYNLRGNDIKNNPVNMAYSIISLDGAILYIDENKLTSEVEVYLKKNNVEIRNYFEIYNDIINLSSSNIILIDPNRVNYKIYSSLDAKMKKIYKANPSTLMKACKNNIEIENLKKCHVKDGVAVTKFMYWLKKNVGKIEMDEISVADYLHNLRKEQEEFLEPSFDTISAYNANAAMMHYKATKENYSKIYSEGMLLVDSGGQYYDGTTDITRTFILGECNEEWKKHFTLVLKGMIKLSKVKFLSGITGTNLDILARESLWAEGIDYKCGTGHGVGFLLNVHEGPQGIRMQYNSQPLLEGMNVTNEPGVYIENSHGIRLENELIVQKGEKTIFGQFMFFETMTYAPLDLDGVIPELLSLEEKRFLNEYHEVVYEKISHYLTDEEKEWLKKYTRKI